MFSLVFEKIIIFLCLFSQNQWLNRFSLVLGTLVAVKITSQEER